MICNDFMLWQLQKSHPHTTKQEKKKPGAVDNDSSVASVIGSFGDDGETSHSGISDRGNGYSAGHSLDFDAVQKRHITCPPGLSQVDTGLAHGCF
jgi:hypothetical protein